MSHSFIKVNQQPMHEALRTLTGSLKGPLVNLKETKMPKNSLSKKQEVLCDLLPIYLNKVKR